MKLLFSFILSCCISVSAFGQYSYGTTGLINMPTADMQRDKTFMLGGSWLNHHGTVPRWWYDTFNYYVTQVSDLDFRQFVHMPVVLPASCCSR